MSPECTSYRLLTTLDCDLEKRRMTSWMSTTLTGCLRIDLTERAILEPEADGEARENLA